MERTLSHSKRLPEESPYGNAAENIVEVIRRELAV
jgi:hypothetical protein